MSVPVIRFEYQGRVGWGVIRNEKVFPIAGECASTGEFIRCANAKGLSALSQTGLGVLLRADVSVLSPVTRNQQFICLGANYRQHMIESGIDPDVKHYNMMFTKAPGCIVPADSDVLKPRCVHFLDYEVELGLVMKRDITCNVNVTEDNLSEFIAGVVVVNDYSARDIQIPQGQFYKGKSFRTFAPIGPTLYLLEPSEMHYLKEFQLTLTVNGEIRQRDTTANLVNGPVETLTEISGIHDLAAGDLIATGTPSGCALTVPSPLKQRIAGLFPEAMKWKWFLKAQERRTQYLQVGDVVESRICSADGAIDLGVQRNVVVAEV